MFFYCTVAAVLEHEAIAGLSGSKPSGMRGRSSSRAEETPEYSLDSLMKSVSEELWATSGENLFMPYANNKGTDRCIDGIIVSSFAISWILPVCVAEQASLSLT